MSNYLTTAPSLQAPQYSFYMKTNVAVVLITSVVFFLGYCNPGIIEKKENDFIHNKWSFFQVVSVKKIEHGDWG